MFFMRKRAFSMGQCDCPKLNPAQGRWWVGRALRSQHNMGRSLSGFWSCRSRRGPILRSSAVGFTFPRMEVLHDSLRAASYSDRHSYALFSRKSCKTSPTRAPLGGRRSRIGARAEATSSKNPVVAYACCAMGLKPSPPTIYHGQGLAWGSHPGSY